MTEKIKPNKAANFLGVMNTGCFFIFKAFTNSFAIIAKGEGKNVNARIAKSMSRTAAGIMDSKRQAIADHSTTCAAIKRIVFSSV